MLPWLIIQEVSEDMTYHKTFTARPDEVDARIDAAVEDLVLQHQVQLELDCCSLIRITDDPEPQVVVLVIAKEKVSTRAMSAR